MPQFVPGPGYVVNTATNEAAVFGGPPAPEPEPQPAPSAAPASTGVSAAEKKRRARERAKKRAERRRAAQAAREQARQNRFNPLATPFKSPAQLREEAIRLAELGSPSEASLREQQAREEAGLTGLTTATQGLLRGLSEQAQAGLMGFGNLYSRLGAQATGATQSAAAAAGAPVSDAPSVSPSVATELAGLALPISTMPAAAVSLGARLRGESQANLAKALTERASRISSDTAKYLQQLQGLEYEKAVAQETARQNAARLGLSAEEQAFDQAVTQQRLGFEGERVAQGWQRIAQSAANAANRAGTDQAKRIRAMQRDLLANRRDILGGGSEFSATYVDTTGVKKIDVGNAKTLAEAEQIAKSVVGSAYADTVKVLPGAPALSESEIVADLVDQLVFEGMTPAAARRWVYRKILRKPVPSGATGGGAFPGGVGGTV